MRFNNMIKETNKSIRLEFYTNASFRPHKYYTFYVRGKHIDYHPFVINSLIHPQLPSRCSIQNRRGVSMNEKTCDMMKNEFCQPGSQWVIVRAKPLRIHTRKTCSIPKALAYFIV